MLQHHIAASGGRGHNPPVAVAHRQAVVGSAVPVVAPGGHDVADADGPIACAADRLAGLCGIGPAAGDLGVDVSGQLQGGDADDRGAVAAALPPLGRRDRGIRVGAAGDPVAVAVVVEPFFEAAVYRGGGLGLGGVVEPP